MAGAGLGIGDRVKRTTIRGVRIAREPYQPGLPFSVDHFDAADNLIETLG
jgi:hypothetical protein